MMTEAIHRKLHGLAEYSAAIDEVISLAGRHIRIFDYNLENMGFNGVARYETLHAFLQANPENRLSVVVHSPDYLNRYCPRMIMLLKRFSHNMEIRQTLPEIAHVYDPFCLADGEHYVRRFHFDDPRGIFAQCDAHEGRALMLRFEQVWQASAPVIYASTTGL
ncbi:MAG: hypothetical protein K2P57_01650 [Burkholderiales bacterium]|nr:hypothetical protein [Burkholderiales bacterium]